MGKQNIKVERLEVRLKGISAQSARSAVDGLGRELLSQLSTLGNLSTAKQPSRIDSLDSGISQMNSGSPPAELRSRIAKRIAAAIGMSLGKAGD